MPASSQGLRDDGGLEPLELAGEAFLHRHAGPIAEGLTGGSGVREGVPNVALLVLDVPDPHALPRKAAQHVEDVR